MKRIIVITLCIIMMPLMVFAATSKIKFSEGSRYVGYQAGNYIKGTVSPKDKQYVVLYGPDGKMLDYKKTDSSGKFDFYLGNLKKGNNYFYVKSLKSDDTEASPTYKINVYYATYYTVKYNPEGGKGTMARQKIRVGQTASLIPNKFKRKDYLFKGWAVKKGAKVKFANKAKVKNLSKTNKTINLYAVWEPAMAEKIARTAETYAWPLGTSSSKFNYRGGRQYRKLDTLGWSKYKFARDGACCCHWAGAVTKKATGGYIGFLLPDTGNPSTAKSLLAKATSRCKPSIFAWDGKVSSLKRGDILSLCRTGSSGHVMIYLGNGKIAHASSDSKYGHIEYFTGSNASLRSKRWYYVVRFN